MFKRKFMQTLLEWKNSKGKKPLLVKGARQIGKTFIIREFGKQNYENVIELNFFKYAGHCKVFEGSLDPQKIYQEISLLGLGELKAGKTLLFFDEIQDCGDARTAFKFLAEDNKFDIIASGSMLGIAYKQTRSIPVGYESQIEMFSMDFEEFLWAHGFNDEKINIYRSYFENKTKIEPFFNDRMFELLREYMIIGGMPAVVNKFLETNNFGEVHKTQIEIIDSYLDDIAKYAPTAEKPKARNCYLSLPKQLAKENKKFQFSVVEKKGTARKFDNSIEWLRDAGLIKLCNNVATPTFPLVAYTQAGYYKVYASDIGILNAMYGFEIKKAIYDNTLKGAMKGGIYENLIADILLKKNLPLYYYKPAENKQEIEFLYTQESNIIPLEVKSGNSATRSLDEFIKEFNPPYVLKFITGNIGQTGTKITLPLYMAMFL
ncbi:MAG: AAA family ATPase [Fibromonadales bacterium]|nr:AAA family ATPase [Fibromonadales bacterium]